jgi:hypothetical protein
MVNSINRRSLYSRVTYFSFYSGFYLFEVVVKGVISIKKTLSIAFITLLLSAGTAWACYVPEVTPPVEECDQDSCVPSIVPSEEPTPEVTEEPQAVSPEPTKVPPPGNVPENPNDGLSSCPECTKAPVVPQAPPMTGRAL